MLIVVLWEVIVKTYQDYLREFVQFKNEQNKQKQRGLNNYNILTTVLKKSDEVRLHSRMIHSLLNPGGTHYQGSLFLEKFIKQLNINDFEIDLNNCSVYKEYKQIDLYITDKNKHIIIENKVYANDQENQIKRYIDIIQKENKGLKSNDILVIYLSLDRSEPSQYSLGDLTIQQGTIKRDAIDIALYKSIHYKREIIEWLKQCQYEVQNITNLNEVINQYADVVKMLNNQYKDKVMQLSEFIARDDSNYRMAEEIHKEFDGARKTLMDSFFDRVVEKLKNKLNANWRVEINGDLSTRYNFPLRIYKEDWVNEQEAYLLFGFEFEKNDYIDGCFGIVRNNDQVDIKNHVFPKFKTELDELSVDIEPTDWWLYWSYLPNDNFFESFPRYVLFNEDAEERFIQSIMKTINIFENNSKLMSKMNAYLNDTHQVLVC